MATLIPSLNSCLPRMTSGERRFAERLEHKLDDDYLVWYDVPIGPKQSHPDFVVLHPRRGLLILETKDWKLETIRRASRQAWDIGSASRRKDCFSHHAAEGMREQVPQTPLENLGVGPVGTA